MGDTDWLELRGRRALVVGAGGLGGAGAAALAGVGAQVTVADRDDKRLHELRLQVKEAGYELNTVTADVGTADGCRELVDSYAARSGGIDTFLHAVGINIRTPVLELSDDQWAQVLRLNLDSGFWLGQAVGKVMNAQRYGRMVFVSSVSGLLAHADHAPYAATKGGLNQMMRVMAREWAANNVTVNAVAPGYIETDLTRRHLDSNGVREHLTALVPAGRLGVPDEVADAVTFLSSDRARFITGQILYVDGGRVLV